MIANPQDSDMYDKYENALKQHLGRVEALFKEQSGVIGANALQLLDVSGISDRVFSFSKCI